MRRLQKIAAVLCVITALLSCTVMSYAAVNKSTAYREEEWEAAVNEDERPQSGDVYSAVQVDNFTGEELNSDNNDRLYLTSGCTFDRVNDSYIYEIGSSTGMTFTANVPFDAKVQSAVILNVPETLTPQLYRNGILLENPDFSNITQTGAYSLSVQNSGEILDSVLQFTILGSYVGKMYEFTPPQNFKIVSAKFSDSSIAYSEDAVDLSEEGEYEITYYSSGIGKSYSVSFTVDHTPPELTFIGLDENNEAHGPVTIEGLEDSDTAELFIDNMQVTFSTTLARAGEYSVYVTDRAGNTSEYAFTIHIYFTNITWIFLIVLCLLSAGIVWFALHRRKNFRTN